MGAAGFVQAGGRPSPIHVAGGGNHSALLRCAGRFPDGLLPSVPWTKAWGRMRGLRRAGPALHPSQKSVRRRTARPCCTSPQACGTALATTVAASSSTSAWSHMRLWAPSTRGCWPRGQYDVVAAPGGQALSGSTQKADRGTDRHVGSPGGLSLPPAFSGRGAGEAGACGCVRSTGRPPCRVCDQSQLGWGASQEVWLPGVLPLLVLGEGV